uniref:cytosolic carboxypeptidase 2 n=1 Tax=Pristiophorus japonicus TaxID=55135 RepID=UPI00398F77BA
MQTTLAFVHSESELQTIVNTFTEAYESLGLTFNIIKTKLLYQSAPATQYCSLIIKIHDEILDKVDHFPYHWSLLWDMCPAAARLLDLEVLQHPYESFIRYHLQHYGYYTGRWESHRMETQSWQQEDGLLSDQNQPETDGSATEAQKYNYSFINEQQLLRTRQVVFDYHAGKPIPRLREPRSLYPVAASGPQQAPRWPIECEVIKEQIRHIEWSPPEPERLYQASWQQHMPACVGDNGTNVVFCIDAARKGSYFTFSRVGGHRGPLHLATIGATSQDCNALIFESRFESGNLQKAIRVGIYEYELTLRTDLYTDKHTQWYYFRVQNTRPGVNYRFTIVNLMKPSSLYNQGLKPLLYSEREAQLKQVGWFRAGKDIQYYKSNLGQEGRSLYSLTWTCQFPHRNDTCYFAHSYPYTYSDLQCYLATIARDPVRSQYCKLRALCRSLAGNTVHVLTVTSPTSNQEAGPAKKAVVVTARVHPGETNASWVMAGFLDHILGSSDDARLLRDMFIFKVVPMLNPDGVIVGNYRCSLTGRDLNRNYRTVLRDSFPCVWHTRNMVQRLMKEREVVIYCDFHGHSRKSNVFMYGCRNNELPSVRLWERVFPLMMSKNATDKFSYQSCKFKVQKSKEGTGRIVMWKMGITHSYTMETTFAGSTLGNRRATHFSTEDLKSLGYHFCDTLLDFCDPDHSKFEQCLGEVRAALQRELRQRLERLGQQYNSDMTLSDLSISDYESSTGGSDSSESDGPPAHLMSLAAKAPVEKGARRGEVHGNSGKAKNAVGKAAWLEAMSTAYLRRGLITTPGQKYDQFAWDGGYSRLTPVSSQRRAVSQRHALPVSIVDQRQCPERQRAASPPIKQHPLPFDADLEYTDLCQRCLSDDSWKLDGHNYGISEISRHALLLPRDQERMPIWDLIGHGDIMESLLKSVPCTVVFQDDILLTRRDTVEHLQNLEEVLSR